MPSTQLEEEFRALLDSRVDACRDKDIDRLMSLYSPDVVYFDCVPPLEFTGHEAVRRNFVRWFDEYEGPIGLETHQLHVAVGESVAVAHMLHLDVGTLQSGDDVRAEPPDRSLWLRSTVCCRRSGSGWLITHEHISLPVDLGTTKAVLDGRPTP